VAGATLLQAELFSSITPQTRSGLLGYAVLFGAAPEIVLRFLDTKVNAVTAAARTENDPQTTVPAQTKTDVPHKDVPDPETENGADNAEAPPGG
jgi:hypothetical protein